MRSVHITPLILLAATAALAAEAPQLVVDSPQAGSVLKDRPFRAGACLLNPGTNPLVVVLTCFGVTHYHYLDQGQLARVRKDRQGNLSVNVWDDAFLPTAGDQILKIEVMHQGQGRLLGPQTVSFRVEDMTPEQLEESLVKLSVQIGQDSANRLQAWSGYANNEFANRHNPQWKPDPFPAQHYASSCNDELWSRIAGYTRAAELYDTTGRGGDAAEALKAAQAIYDAQSAALLEGPHLSRIPVIYAEMYHLYPPSHFDGWTRYYVRRGNLTQATFWLQEQANWYRQAGGSPYVRDTFRNDCPGSVAWAYREIARLHILLKQDFDGYTQWMAKAQQATGQPVAAPPPGVDLLQQHAP
jgi:hypothetical protein